METIRLLKSRSKAAREARVEEIMRGSLVVMERICGKLIRPVIPMPLRPPQRNEAASSAIP